MKAGAPQVHNIKVLPGGEDEGCVPHAGWAGMITPPWAADGTSRTSRKDKDTNVTIQKLN